jgi:preprotein translocase subunit SecE
LENKTHICESGCWNLFAADAIRAFIEDVCFAVLKGRAAVCLNSNGVFAKCGSEQTQSETSVMATTNPLQFIQQVRAEVSKIVWPTRREVLLTTVMVFIMAALTAVFFALVDILIRSGLQGLLNIFG